MILRHEYAKAATCALSFCFSLACFFTLQVASFIHGFSLAVLWFQVWVSHWSLWFPHVRGRLCAPDSLAWRWNAWQVLWRLWMCQWYVKLSLAPEEEGFMSLWGMLGVWLSLLLLSRSKRINISEFYSVRRNWKFRWRYWCGKLSFWSCHAALVSEALFSVTQGIIALSRIPHCMSFI